MGSVAKGDLLLMCWGGMLWRKCWRKREKLVERERENGGEGESVVERAEEVIVVVLVGGEK